MFPHRVERNVLRGFGRGGDPAGVLVGEKTLRNHDEQNYRRDEDRPRHQHRDAAMAHEQLQRTIRNHSAARSKNRSKAL